MHAWASVSITRYSGIRIGDSGLRTGIESQNTCVHGGVLIFT